LNTGSPEYKEVSVVANSTAAQVRRIYVPVSLPRDRQTDRQTDIHTVTDNYRCDASNCHAGDVQFGTRLDTRQIVLQ